VIFSTNAKRHFSSFLFQLKTAIIVAPR